MPDTVTIYGLKTADSRILYVGQTTQSIETRKRRHWQHAVDSQAKSPIASWFRTVGLEAVVAVELETAAVDQRIDRESFWIQELKTLVADGGLNTRLSYGWAGGRPEAVAYAAEMNRRLAEDPDLQERSRRASAEGVRRFWDGNEEAREQTSERMRRVMADPAVKAKHSESMRRALDEGDLREKLSDGQRRRFSTDEGRRQLSEMGRVGGAKGGHISGHRRWHVARGIVSPTCDLCAGES